MGGVKTLWVGAYEEDIQITLDATTGEVEKVKTSAGDVKFYKFQLPIDIGDAVEDVNADPKLGTSFVAQTINGTLLGLSQAYSKELSGMMKGKQVIVTELYDSSFILYGAYNGLDMTGGGSRTGAEAASLQGYELTWTGKERDYAPFAEAVTKDESTPGQEHLIITNV